MVTWTRSSDLLNTPRLAVGLLLVTALGLAACQSEETPPSYVARVGDQHLTEADVQRMIEEMGPTPDSSEARQQVIDQWVRRTLLYREARRLNLASVADVQRKLEQQRRSVLITAMTDRLYEQAEASPSDEEVRTYFEGHKAQLKLREPYVRIRYLSTDSQASAQTVRDRLTSSPVADSTWARLVQTHAKRPEHTNRLSGQFLPQGRIARALPLAESQIANVGTGELAPLVEIQGTYHVLQITDRLPTGAEPRIEWFEDEIRRRLRIRARKQTYTREVQRLRSKARANGVLETP